MQQIIDYTKCSYCNDIWIVDEGQEPICDSCSPKYNADIAVMNAIDAITAIQQLPASMIQKRLSLIQTMAEMLNGILGSTNGPE